MPYLADLSPFEHFGSSTIVWNPATRCYKTIAHKGLRVLSVGWLDARHTFPTAQSNIELVKRLERFYQYRVNQTRGVQICELCPDSRRKAKWPDCWTNAVILNRKIVLGSAEIRVPDKAGVVYACPDLIYHYIQDHEYDPPSEFVEAVMSTDGAITLATLLRAHGVEVL